MEERLANDSQDGLPISIRIAHRWETEKEEIPLPGAGGESWCVCKRKEDESWKEPGSGKSNTAYRCTTGFQDG